MKPPLPGMVERRDENRFATEREDGRSFKTWESVKKGSLLLLFHLPLLFLLFHCIGLGRVV